MTTNLDRAELENAIDVLSRGAVRFSEPVLATMLAVLRERIAAANDTRDQPTGPGATVPDEQRKQVTILFASIDGLTARTQHLPEEQRVPFINQLWAMIDDMVAFHGGLIDKHMGDVVMCLFGAPVAGENDAERAVRCALAMAESVGAIALGTGDAPGDDEPLAIRIGLNTGLVVLGQVGTDDAPTVIGDPVNVASRLKDAAAMSGVYIAHETYRLVEALFQVEPLGLLPVRGRRTAVTVYRVVGSRPRAFFPTRLGVRGVAVPMVGRQEEMELLLLSAAEALRTGRGRCITIIGEAGVGKSRLAAEFNRRLESFPVRPGVLQGRGEARLQASPLGLVRQLISDLAHTDGDELLTTAGGVLPKQRGPKRFRPAPGVNLAALGGRLGAAFPSLPTGADVAVEPKSVADELIGQLGELARRNPLTIIFVEDIHWADDESLGVLERVARLAHQAPLVVVCLARPGLLERRPDWPRATAVPGQDDDGHSLIRLRPLAVGESHELVHHILRHLAAIPDELSDLIVRAGGGNPYFVEELIKVMIDDGLIVAGEGEWILRPGRLPRLRVPATLTGVLQARLDRLPEPERLTLQQAAVIGDEFWDTSVHYLNQAARRPVETEQLAAALQALEGRELVYRVDSRLPDAAAYRFTHAALFEVAYDSVLLRDRPAYHLAAARWLELESEGLGAEYAAEIARHYERGGEVGRAAAAYQQAAAWAETRYNTPVAIDYYRKVLALTGDLPQYIDRRLRAHERLGAALWRQGGLTEALESYQTMRDIAELDGNLLMHARAENALATVCGLLHDQAGMVDHAQRAARVAWLTGSERDLIQALLNQAEAEALGGRVAAALELAEEAAQMALVQDMDLEIVRSLALVGRLQTPAEAEATATRLGNEIERLARAGQTDAAALGRCLLAGLMLGSGARRQAAKLATDALRAVDSIEDRDLLAEALLIGGRVLLATGDGAAAAATFEAALAAADVADHVLYHRRAELGLAEAQLFSGQPAPARAQLEAILAAADREERERPATERAEVLALLAMALHDEGDPRAGDLAEAALQTLIESGQAAVAVGPMAVALAAIGEVLMTEPERIQPSPGGEPLTAIVCFERAARWLEIAAAVSPSTHRRRRLLLAWADEAERQGYRARAAGLRVQADEISR